MEPHYAHVPLHLGDSSDRWVMCCGWCGALVPVTMQPTHNAWHSQLAQVASQASYADMVSRPIG